MAELTIYRGTHQIGGCCTELVSGGERILIDLGANLPNTDAPIRDDELVEKVFDGRSAAGLLFTHPHGDHYGLYKKVPRDVPMYIGPLAKDILRLLTHRLDYRSDEKGLPAVERMETYRDGEELGKFSNIRVTPLAVDHSAPDAYMFYIQTAGKRILFTGDFREHGVLGQEGRLWARLKERIPEGVDLLVTEGTMLSRDEAAKQNPIQTEEQLGEKAAELFGRHKYNFVLVSSTNLDSIMEFYSHTPWGMCFVCDDYQAEVMLTAMGARKEHPRYGAAPEHPVIYVLWKPRKGSTAQRQEGYAEKRCAVLRKKAKDRDVPLDFRVADPKLLFRNGFVMLARKNRNPAQKSVFEIMRDKFYPVDGQIIYSMWDGYLKPGHLDQDLSDYIGDRRVEHLHTSGHAYVETIAKLIETVRPKVIVPMHTERAEEFAAIPEFAPYQDRVRILKDGERLLLDTL